MKVEVTHPAKVSPKRDEAGCSPFFLLKGVSAVLLFAGCIAQDLVEHPNGST